MGRKKTVMIDDDEYSLPIDEQQVQASEKENRASINTGSKKNKKGGGGAKSQRHGGQEDLEIEQLAGAEDEEAKMSKDNVEEEDELISNVFSGKKKASKSKKDRVSQGNNVANVTAIGKEEGNQQDEEDAPVIVSFSGKKKPSKTKKEKNSQASSSFDALSDVEDNQEDEYEEKPNAVTFSGMKKPSKSNTENSFPTSSAFNALGEDEDSQIDDGEAEPLTLAFTGKKKPSKTKKNKSSNSTIDSSVGEEAREDKSDQQPPSLNEANSHEEAELKSSRQSELDDTYTRKQQPKKKKKGGRTAQEEEDLDKILAELGEGLQSTSLTVTPVVPEANPADNELKEADVDSSRQDGAFEDAASKNKQQKKKKKKGGRTFQEEEDLEKILAELGDGPQTVPSSSAPPSDVIKGSVKLEPVQSKVSTDIVPDEKEGEAEEVESAAAKKKKKKKEKEKEKKAAAAAASAVTVEEEIKEEKKDAAKGKAADKKLPKHVREMQEALARRKEAEETKKREEEERLRKEEEERKRLEELERLAEEAKKRKKEREKEKLLKKKQEGKLLTAKQKEEQKRLDAMRRQFLSQNDNLSADVPRETKKRPIYQAKKAKAAQTKTGDLEKVTESQNEVVELDVVQPDEDDMVEETLSQHTEVQDQPEDKQEQEESETMEEDEEDEEWDAKSWDDVDVKLPGTSPFAEEDKEELNAATFIAKGGEHGPSSAPAVAPDVATAKRIVDPQVSSKKGGEVNGHEISDTVAKAKNNVGVKLESNHSQDTTKKSGGELRSPICCILGHVDTGKTKLLDCIRRTNVQEGEAGGITQQIGATYFPTENIRERTKELKADSTLRVPGLLVIDTPGHESFSNLRSRGSSLCDIAILVVDIMHGLEPQTIESLNLLKSRNTEFIVALNKVDRLYGWKKCPDAPIRKAMNQQSNDVKNEFNMRLTQIITQLKEQGLNTALYYKNRDLGETFNIVPTSAVSGEGIPDLLLLLVQWAQKTMEDKLTYVDEVQCTVLEVKVIEGLGTTIDVVLVNGTLHEGDQIIVCGMQGPIVTNIRALMTPHPMKELRVKGSYIHHKQLKAAQGVKISAQGLEHAIAGTALYAVKPGDDIEAIKDAVMHDVNKVMSRIDKSGEGVYVQASTLGSLEALTEFLKSPAVNIPFSDFSIGPVHKKDVMKASVMLERKKEYATILAFDVKVMPEARELAEESGVRIFVADIIYHLFDQFKAYIDNLREEKKKQSAEEAVFPCVLKIMPNCVFNKKDPIVLGVNVLEGIAKIGTPICIPSRDFIDIGRIASIEINHKQVDVATKDQKVAIKIVSNNAEEQQKMFGRHFEIEDELVSHISRRSIDVLKTNYRDDLSNDEWRLVVKLKNVFKIP
ncbi:eukaryotic translation initiation factor 5B-like [Phalaenopsis equestris]|uniref:eukaryotic translation initiation factor 5B-like n=1 Tax=Phalaenopsis equestris TaxID=78828 RepID=UPI0009E5893E|nr:eukaryotic translation initiation factor 5B-like [Phalaenopsis equestris]